jgi:hypothetical protein
MKTYRLSPSGRRMTLMLIVGALLVWAFALWSFANTLNISYHPLRFWPSLSTSLANGPGIDQLIPALLMLAMIVATPLVVWNLLEEWAAAYTPTSKALRFESLGIALHYPWETITAIETVDDDREAPRTELVLAQAGGASITNPIIRFLHHQAFGHNRLPIYAGLEAREELVSEIRRHLNQAQPHGV